MPNSDDYGFSDDDTAFLEAATQVEASQQLQQQQPQQNGGFAASPRPRKRRRLRRGPGQLDGASSDELEWSETDDEGHSPPKQSTYFQQSTAAQAPTQATATAGDDEIEDEGDGATYYYPEELRGPDGQPEAAAKKQSKYKIHIPRNAELPPDAIFTQTQAGLDSSPGAIRGAIWKRPKPPPPPMFDAPARPAINGRPVGNGQSTVANGLQRQGTLNGLFKPPSADLPRHHPDGAEDDAAMAARLQAEENELFHHHNANRPNAGLGNGFSRPQPQTMNRVTPAYPNGMNGATSQQLHEELADLPSDAFSSSSPEKSPQKDVIELSSQPAASYQPGLSQPPQRPQALRGPQTGLKQMTIFGAPATQEMSASQAAKKKHAWPLKSRDEPPTHHKLDDEGMKTWVYPTNLGTVRDYQYNIVARSLFHNTLVALPTGLGKTFIAATIMLNFYRWTKDAQLVFMAPTKPLIAQQMDACYHIVGIPRRDTVLMTGETAPAVRADEWSEKRVFFMTPQTVINDLKTGICDPKKLCLLVVDEAHKATGGYAYTEVVSFLRRFNPSFRVLALTATPGSTVEAVQAVIDHLGIARVELRTEQSLDIRPYTHEKHTELEVFQYSDEQNLIMEHLSKALRPALNKLNQQNAYWSKDPMALTQFGLQQARGKWMSSDAGRKVPQGLKGMINSLFTTLMSLAHSIGLLKNHGIVPFYTKALAFQQEVDSGKTKAKNPKEIVESPDWSEMMGRVRGWTNNPDFIGHPKLAYLREVVLNHFLDAGEGALGSDAPPSATRVMVFASFRDSTEEIVRVLKRNEPMIRPHVFVGQAASQGSEGMNQKKQNEVIQQFKAGKFNTLVATSIGEEGLDIGDVDLIVCYDASSSPIRMLQRIGRTGRKRVGKVVLLLMSGKEEKDYEKAQDNYSFIQKSIADASKYNYRDDQSPRILPKEAVPVVDKRVIEIPIENSQPVDLNEKGRKPGRTKSGRPRKRPEKKFHMPDNVRTGFVKASRLDSDDDADVSDEPVSKKVKTGVPAKKKTPAKAKQPVRQPSPEPEPAQLPYLADVLLSAEQQSELERKYAHTADDDDAIVRAPDPLRYPETLRHLGASRYVPHARSAEVVARGLRAANDVNDDKVRVMKEGFDESMLRDSGPARVRLVSPAIDADSSDDDLPAEPVPAPISRPAKTKKPPAKEPPTKKPPGRTTAAKQARKAPPKRVMSYGSEAMEGSDSEPEATQADMRIGTQGIDLGSRDTSGEDEDEAADSELEAFIARSDEVIETVSSSLPGTPQVKKKGLQRRKGGGKAPELATIISSDEEEQQDDEDADKSDDTVTAPRPAARKKRIVADSDSE